MNTGLDSYDHGRKNTWRGTVWNCIVERLPEFAGMPSERVKRLPASRLRAATKSKTVVYLAGPEDLDRQCALSRGFLPQNIFAVDRESDVVSGIRRAGGMAINGDLGNVVAAWTNKLPIDVLIVDLCGGVGQAAVKMVSQLMASSGMHRDTVVCANLLKGRDSYSNQAREINNRIMQSKGWDDQINHRGSLLFGIWAAFWNDTCQIEDEASFNRHTNGIGGSYLSANGINEFQWCVFRWFGDKCDQNLLPDDLMAWLAKSEKLIKSTSRQLAAVMANRTKKLQAVG